VEADEAPLLALGLLIAVTPWLRQKLSTAGPTMRIGLILFVIAPVFFFLVAMLIAVFSEYAPLALRCLFLIFVIFIPPGLYYLFIATRRESLLNSYVSNLSRLGLFRRGGSKPSANSNDTTAEEENDRARRIHGYIERFEALYGRLPPDYVAGLIAATRAPVGNIPSQEFPKAPSTSSYVDLKTMLPVVSAMILSAIGWAIVLPPSLKSSTLETSWSTALSPDISPVSFAFIGSYFFGIQMILRRFVRRDLGPNAYNAISARMILSIIGVWVLQEVATILSFTSHLEYLYILAFAIGVFPQMIWQLITASIKRFKYFSFSLPNLTASMPLSSLEGLSVWHQARLEEEDIENIPNLAMADIVELMLTTKFPPHRIIDWIDQALLRMILGDQDTDPQGGSPQDGSAQDGSPQGGSPQRGSANSVTLSAKLRSYGVRTATTLVAFCARHAVDGRRIFDLLPEADQPRVSALAAALTTAPNLPLVQTWLGLQTISMGEVFPATERAQAAESGLALVPRTERVLVLDGQSSVETKAAS
jgi:hypothetical protein